MVKRYALSLICTAALLTFSIGSAWGQDTATESAATQSDLPSVEEIVAKYLEATGGEEKHNALKSVVATGELEIPEMGITGTFTMKQMEPNLSKMEMEIGGVGSQSQGYDGETAWQNNGITGPEIMDGEQKDQFVMQSDLQPFVNLDEKFDEVKVTGTEEHDGEECYVVVVKNGDNDPITHYFSVESGLHTGTKINQITPQGKMEIVTTVSDYRDVGNGLKMSHKASSSLPIGISQVITMTSIKINEDLEESDFDLPEEIKDIK